MWTKVRWEVPEVTTEKPLTLTPEQAKERGAGEPKQLSREEAERLGAFEKPKRGVVQGAENQAQRLTGDKNDSIIDYAKQTFRNLFRQMAKPLQPGFANFERGHRAAHFPNTEAGRREKRALDSTIATYYDHRFRDQPIFEIVMATEDGYYRYKVLNKGMNGWVVLSRKKDKR